MIGSEDPKFSALRVLKYSTEKLFWTITEIRQFYSTGKSYEANIDYFEVLTFTCNE